MEEELASPTKRARTTATTATGTAGTTDTTTATTATGTAGTAGTTGTTTTGATATTGTTVGAVPSVLPTVLHIVQPLLYRSVEEKLAWGYSFDYFNRALVQATILLTSFDDSVSSSSSSSGGAVAAVPSSTTTSSTSSASSSSAQGGQQGGLVLPHFTKQIFELAFQSCQPMSLTAQLSGLTYIELCMLVCVVRLHVLGRAFTVSHVSSDSLLV